jgi:hypothetical protein
MGKNVVEGEIGESKCRKGTKPLTIVLPNNIFIVLKSPHVTVKI